MPSYKTTTRNVKTSWIADVIMREGGGDTSCSYITLVRGNCLDLVRVFGNMFMLQIPV